MRLQREKSGVTDGQRQAMDEVVENEMAGGSASKIMHVG